METEKIITYHVDAGDGVLIADDLESALEYEGASRRQIEYAVNAGELEPDEDGILMEITITVKKIMTRDELNNLPEKS